MATQGDNSDVQSGTPEQMTQRLLSQLLVQVEGMTRRMDLQDAELSRLRITQPAIRQTVPAAMAETIREDLSPVIENQSRGTTDQMGSEEAPPARERGSFQLERGLPSSPVQQYFHADLAPEYAKVVNAWLPGSPHFQGSFLILQG